MHSLNGALPGPYVPVRVTRDTLVAHQHILMRRLAAEPRSTAGILIPSQCPSGTIFLTPYSMVWNWRVSRAVPMLFYWPKLLYPYCGLPLFFPFSSSVHRLILRMLGLRTERVYISLSLHCRPLLIIIKSNSIGRHIIGTFTPIYVYRSC